MTRRSLDEDWSWAASARPAAHGCQSLIAAGVDIKTVSAWLGHSTAKLTLDTYGHLMGTDGDRAALDRVNRVLGSLTGPAEVSEPYPRTRQGKQNGR